MLCVVRPRTLAVLGCLSVWALSPISSVSYAQPATTSAGAPAQAATSGTPAAPVPPTAQVAPTPQPAAPTPQPAAPTPQPAPAAPTPQVAPPAPAPAVAAQTPAAAPVTTGAIAAPVEPVPVEPPLAWDLLHRRYNTWNGPTGGISLVDASTGEVGAVRIQLGLDFFSGSDYLNTGDEIDVRDQILALSFTPLKVLEVFASLANRAVSRPEPDGRTLDSLGDFSLGAKIAGHLAPGFWLSGDVRAMLGGQVGSSGQAWESTSVGLRAAFTLDLQEFQKPAPFVARVNVGYLFDSSANLVKDVEQERYEELGEDAEDEEDETAHLVDRFERLAFGINRLDKLTLGLGVELPLQLGDEFFLHPVAEFQIGVPVNRQGYDCPYYAEDPDSGKPSSPNDSCYERNPESAPMNLLFGVRVVPPLRGLSVMIGADIGLSGTDMFVRELQPNLPYRVMIALSYDYDARPVPERVITVTEPAPPPVAAVVAPAPNTGRVQGVTATADGMAVAGAVVAFPDQPTTALSTAPDGSFVSVPFAPGMVSLNVTHPDYENATCSTAIPETGGDVGLRCVMVARPRHGALAGRVTDAYGTPLPGARVVLTGPGGTLVMTDADGAFLAQGVTAGDYNVRVEASGFFSRQTTATVVARTTSRMDVSVARKPSKSGIILRPDASVEAPALTWTGEAVALGSGGEQAVAELAELLLSRPDLNARIQTPGSPLVAQPRADLIKARLVAAGVAAHRIEAVGGGQRLRITVRP